MRRFEYAGIPPDVQLKTKLEALTLRFPKGQSTIEPGQVGTIRQIDALLAALNDTLRAVNRQASVELVGQTDSDGTDQGTVHSARHARMPC